MITLSWDQVRRWRVARQRLDRRVPRRRLLEVVRDVCGVHAQVPSSAELQVWTRVAGATREDVRDALWIDRTLVRSWAMRGTLHVLTAEDWPVYAAALGTHDRWWKGAWLRMIGLTADQLRGTLDAIRDSLGARPLTREQLADKVAERAGPRGRERMLSGWGEMLKPASFEGSLISGPPRGQSVTFVRPDRWLASWSTPDGEEAMREVLRRYLRTYGPASREEFARWWGTQPAPAGRVIASMPEGELTEVDVDGQRGWVLTEDVADLRRRRATAPLRLVPAFDVYVIGTRPRASLVDQRFEDRVYRQAGWVSPVVLVDGRVAGVWRHDRTGDRISVIVEPFARLGPAHRRELSAEVKRLGRFLGAPADLTVEKEPR
jgi:winged helix DNA-binding protein